jgi:hypothetical protein
VSEEACPGCRLVLPGAGPRSSRINASAACVAVHDRIAAFEAQHASLARYRQLRVDTYGAAHPGVPTPPIRVAYGLVGLHLALDRGVSGDGVRLAHSSMGRPGPGWPRFDGAPTAEVTVLDVAAAGADAGSIRGHAETLVRWARSVWSAWTPAHGPVAELTGRLFTGGETFWRATDTYLQVAEES